MGRFKSSQRNRLQPPIWAFVDLGSASESGSTTIIIYNMNIVTLPIVTK